MLLFTFTKYLTLSYYLLSSKILSMQAILEPISWKTNEFKLIIFCLILNASSSSIWKFLVLPTSYKKNPLRRSIVYVISVRNHPSLIRIPYCLLFLPWEKLLGATPNIPNSILKTVLTECVRFWLIDCPNTSGWNPNLFFRPVRECNQLEFLVRSFLRAMVAYW